MSNFPWDNDADPSLRWGVKPVPPDDRPTTGPSPSTPPTPPEGGSAVPPPPPPSPTGPATDTSGTGDTT